MNLTMKDCGSVDYSHACESDKMYQNCLAPVCFHASLIVIIVFLGFCAKAQISFGVGALTSDVKLQHIMKGTSLRGHASGDYNLNSRVSIFPSFLLSKPVFKKYNLTSGVGYYRVKHEFHFDYFNRDFLAQIDRRFEMQLTYLSVPLKISRLLFESKNKSCSWHASVGLNIDFLIHEKENYQEIVIEFINLSSREWFLSTIYTADLSIYHSWDISNRKINLGFNISRNLSKFINDSETWGFYENLNPTYHFFYGLNVQFYIN